MARPAGGGMGLTSQLGAGEVGVDPARPDPRARPTAPGEAAGLRLVLLSRNHGTSFAQLVYAFAAALLNRPADGLLRSGSNRGRCPKTRGGSLPGIEKPRRELS